MKPYSEMTKEELLELKRDLSDQYREFQGKNLTLDMSRGKPSAEQLDLSMGMMDVLSSDSDLTCEDGADCRAFPAPSIRAHGFSACYRLWLAPACL